MLRRGWHSRWTLALLLALVALAAGSLQDFGVHTDDGCRTETHCRLCQSIHGGVAGLSVRAPDLAWLALAGDVLPVPVVRIATAQPRLPASRGPPLSS